MERFVLRVLSDDEMEVLVVSRELDAQLLHVCKVSESILDRFWVDWR